MCLSSGDERNEDQGRYGCLIGPSLLGLASVMAMAFDLLSTGSPYWGGGTCGFLDAGHNIHRTSCFALFFAIGQR